MRFPGALWRHKNKRGEIGLVPRDVAGDPKNFRFRFGARLLGGRQSNKELAMIDHVGFPVSDYSRSKAFYEKALAPLGYLMIMEVQQNEHDAKACGFGFGPSGKPDFWIGGEGGLDKPVHIAIAAKNRAAVDAFYEAAIAAGAKDNGAPGLRPHYHANYYGAFVLDPDGHNIEAVSHGPA